MKKTSLFAAAAILASITTANAADTAAPAKEKCYGVAKAGKNDCAWSGGSCAGSTKADNAASAWLLLPQGLCDKIAGGSLTEPKS